ncbi:TPA: LPXTG cell wall anchor domain-containing protein, partial [Streptococcus suis]|nr:LPXTG cell wall anchor domain-containing protein [Streptococcus suis]HEM5163250.1 LPXTG cell wall anchor domain-containing protein [Streptococcus suis]
ENRPTISSPTALSSTTIGQQTTVSKATVASLPNTGGQDSSFLPLVGWATLLAAGSIARKRKEDK